MCRTRGTAIQFPQTWYRGLDSVFYKRDTAVISQWRNNKWQCCFKSQISQGLRWTEVDSQTENTLPAELNLSFPGWSFLSLCHTKGKSRLDISPRGFYLQLSSIRMKSLMPRFSRKTPEDEVVLNRKEMSALSSPWKVGKWRYDVSLSKNAAFQTFSANDIFIMKSWYCNYVVDAFVRVSAFVKVWELFHSNVVL